MARPDRECNVGYACGGTCISKKKVCLKKLGTNRAKEIGRRFVSTIKTVIGDIDTTTETSPDLVSDV